MTQTLFPTAPDKAALERGEVLTPRFGADGLMPAIKAVLPLFKLLADVFLALFPVIITPFRILAAVVGPMIQMISCAEASSENRPVIWLPGTSFG